MRALNARSHGSTIAGRSVLHVDAQPCRPLPIVVGEIHGLGLQIREYSLDGGVVIVDPDTAPAACPWPPGSDRSALVGSTGGLPPT